MYTEILNLVQHMFEILQWIAPGYLTIWFYNTLRENAHTSSVSSPSVVVSVLLSAIYDNILYILCPTFMAQTQPFWIMLILCGIGLAIGWLTVKIVQSKFFLETYSKFNHTLPYDSVLVGNLRIGNNICLRLRDGTACDGRLAEFDTCQEHAWIALDCMVVTKDDKTVIDTWQDPDVYSRIIVNLNDVVYMVQDYDDGDVKYPDNWEDQAEKMRQEQAALDSDVQMQRMQDLRNKIDIK